jgi:2-polyprenyl-3-methyl-5-hydroxy-6-metoxy-1,4-benzoquinol methylase
MTQTSYQFEHSWQHEKERLAAMQDSLDGYTTTCLLGIGVQPGWSCLEVGAGSGSIAAWLAQQVGERGRVVATDLEIELAAAIRAPNIELRKHDIRSDPLEEAAYDLVHARKVLEHLEDPRSALDRMVTATRPGGWVVVEDADLLSLRHFSAKPDANVQRGFQAFIESMMAAGYQAELGLHLADHLRDAGLTQIKCRGWTSEWGGAGPGAAVYQRTFEKIASRVVAEGRLSQDEAKRFLAEIGSPSFHAFTGIHFAAWGQRA